PKKIQSERNQQIDPGSGVANYAVPEIRLMYAKVSNIRLRLYSGQASGDSSPHAADGEQKQPYAMPAIRAMRIEVVRQPAGQHKEAPEPHRHAQHPAVEFVALSLDAFLR